MTEPFRYEKPILFSEPMVHAVIDDIKWQTRRTSGLKKVNDAPADWSIEDQGIDAKGYFVVFRNKFSKEGVRLYCPYGRPGWSIWVREKHGFMKPLKNICYAADGGWAEAQGFAASCLIGKKWTPAIHMKRENSRFNLKNRGIRIERLQDITEEDAKAEGARFFETPSKSGFTHRRPSLNMMIYKTARDSFIYLINELNGPTTWKENPWVWVVDFSKVTD